MGEKIKRSKEIIEISWKSAKVRVKSIKIKRTWKEKAEKETRKEKGSKS